MPHTSSRASSRLRLLHALWRAPSLLVSLQHALAGLGFMGANLVLARALPPQSFARIALVIALVNLLAPLGPLGLQTLVVRHRLQPSRRLLRRGLASTAAIALGALGLGALVYALEPLELGLLPAAVLAGGAATLAAAHFQSRERFGIAVFLFQGANYFLLAAALATVALGARGSALPLMIFALAQAAAAWWAWQRLLAGPVDEGPGLVPFPWRETLLLTGIHAVTLVMIQLERLVIPLVLPLDQLARFAALAAFALAPFRALEMAVARTLPPRLRNTAEVAARRRVLAAEAGLALVLGLGAAAAVWLLTPWLATWVLADKFAFPPALVLAVIVAAALRVAASLVNAAITALADTPALGGWNLIGLLAVLLAATGAVLGARFGLVGVVYGVACGTVLRIALGLPMLRRHMGTGGQPPGG